MPDLAITPLAEAPAARAVGAVCARWLNDEWGRAQGYSLAETAAWLAEVSAPGSGEAAVVALEGERPVGICLLVACDLEERAALSPWISALYVLPQRRRQGIGRALVAAVEDLARNAGAPRLYLYTRGTEAFYRSLGWTERERIRLDGKRFTLMEKHLKSFPAK